MENFQIVKFGRCTSNLQNLIIDIRYVMRRSVLLILSNLEFTWPSIKQLVETQWLQFPNHLMRRSPNDFSYKLHREYIYSLKKNIENILITKLLELALKIVNRQSFDRRNNNCQFFIFATKARRPNFFYIFQWYCQNN